MSEITPSAQALFTSSVEAISSVQSLEKSTKKDGTSADREPGSTGEIHIGHADMREAIRSVEEVIKVASDIALSFSIEEDLTRMVVIVRAVGSDEIIRQFPPEEFLTVAKHIASQNPEMLDEDYLKGILFNQYT